MGGSDSQMTTLTFKEEEGHHFATGRTRGQCFVLFPLNRMYYQALEGWELRRGYFNSVTTSTAAVVLSSKLSLLRFAFN